MRGEPLPVGGAFDDDVVAGVGESVEGAVAPATTRSVARSRAPTTMALPTEPPP